MTPTAALPSYDTFAEASIVREVPLGLLTPSPTNPRKHFDPEKLQELASDLTARGILSPLRVRPRGAAFEIVFGERRYRAAQIATLAAAPCIIGDLTDVEVLELQIAENIQRADMTPIEESDAFARLQDMDPKYREVKVLAAQVGKSVTTVRELLRLQTLVPAVREALEADEITMGHAKLIARIRPDGQATALKECFYALYGEKTGERQLKSLKDFEGWFNNNVLLDVAHEEVTETFPELAGAIAKAAAAGGDIVRLTSYGAGGATKPKKGESPILHPGQYREVKAKDACGVTGVFVLGRDRGRILKVCVDQKCKTHWPESHRSPATSRKSSGSSASTAETKEQKQKRVAKEAAVRRKRELELARKDIVTDRAIDAFLDVATSPESHELLLRCVVCDMLRGDVGLDLFNKRFGTKATYRTKPTELKALTGDKIIRALAFCIADSDLNNAYGNWDRAEVLKAFKVDIARIDKDVAEEQAAQEKAAESAAAPSAAKKKPAGKAKAKAKAKASKKR